MKKEVHVLTIGNSFTDSLSEYFPQVAESAGAVLHFERANFGGCELERHWSYIKAEEETECCRIYQGGRKLRDILSSCKWDYVTIQQASHASWDYSTYLPWADYIAAFVRKYAPSAELLIQQTWAYNPMDSRLQKGGWGFDQNGMYERLTDAYRNLAEHLHCRIIPTGYAVQSVRKNQPYPFKGSSPEEIQALHWPDLPRNAGEPVGSFRWQKNAEGKLVLGGDTIHLNKRGEYLQSCVWFAMLFESPASNIRFVPDIVDKDDAQFLRETAQKAVDEFPQKTR